MFKKLLGTTLLILCILGVACTGAKAENVINNINEKNIEIAVEKYQKLKDDEKTKVDDMLKENINEQYQLFYDKKVTAVESMKEILKLKEFQGVSSYAEEIKNKINVLSVSRKSFEDASSSESKGIIYKAIQNYEKVDKSDTENYEIAQKKIIELKVLLDEQNKKRDEQIEEQNKKQEEKRIAEDNKYVITSTYIVKGAFGLNDGIQVLIQNNSDVPVKEITLGVFTYDKNGLPVKVSNLAGGDIYMGIKDTNANIMPGEVFGSDRVIETYLDLGTVGYAKACLIEVIDYDGKKWTNSQYSQWYLDNYDKKYE